MAWAGSLRWCNGSLLAHRDSIALSEQYAKVDSGGPTSWAGACLCAASSSLRTLNNSARDSCDNVATLLVGEACTAASRLSTNRYLHASSTQKVGTLVNQNRACGLGLLPSVSGLRAMEREGRPHLKPCTCHSPWAVRWAAAAAPTCCTFFATSASARTVMTSDAVTRLHDTPELSS